MGGEPFIQWPAGQSAGAAGGEPQFFSPPASPGHNNDQDKTSDSSSDIADDYFTNKEYLKALNFLASNDDEFGGGSSVKEGGGMLNKRCEWGFLSDVAQVVTIHDDINYAFWYILKELGLFSGMYDSFDTFVKRLNNLADVFVLEVVLRDLFWSILVQLWVAEHFVTKRTDFSFEFAETVKTTLRHRLTYCKQHPIDKSNIDGYHRQKIF